VCWLWFHLDFLSLTVSFFLLHPIPARPLTYRTPSQACGVQDLELCTAELTVIFHSLSAFQRLLKNFPRRSVDFHPATPMVCRTRRGLVNGRIVPGVPYFGLRPTDRLQRTLNPEPFGYRPL
jgi:hypothetical protein